VISRGISWTHRLAVDQTQRRFNDLVRCTQADDFDVDASYAAVCEVLLWACIADEGFDAVFGPKKSSRNQALANLRQSSDAGQHMLAARWARNKMVHCLATPTSSSGQLGKETADASLRWLPAAQVFDEALGAEDRKTGLEQYNELFDGREVISTFKPVIAWVSEVRYDYRDPNWADRWFDARGTSIDN